MAGSATVITCLILWIVTISARLILRSLDNLILHIHASLCIIIQGGAFFMPNYSGGMAICPFYAREAQYSIFCAYDPCDIQDVGGVALKFRSVEGKVAHQR